MVEQIPTIVRELKHSTQNNNICRPLWSNQSCDNNMKLELYSIFDRWYKFVFNCEKQRQQQNKHSTVYYMLSLLLPWFDVTKIENMAANDSESKSKQCWQINKCDWIILSVWICVSLVAVPILNEAENQHEYGAATSRGRVIKMTIFSNYSIQRWKQGEIILLTLSNFWSMWISMERLHHEDVPVDNYIIIP